MLIQVVNAIAYSGNPVEESEERSWELTTGVPWDVTSDNVIKFVQKVNQKIRQSAKEYSTFRQSPNNVQFPTLLNRYIDDENEFQDFHTTYTSRQLIQQLRNSRLEEGAVIVFVHFKIRQEPETYIGEDAPEYALEDLEVLSNQFQVLMVRNTGALKFTDDLQIAETAVIDLKQFVQGCQIDLTRFIQSQADESLEADNFLTFIKGGGDVRDYFKEALFAEKGITNKASSQNVELALNDFWTAHKTTIDRTVRDQINSRVYTFSEERKNQTVTLAEISSIVDGCIPDEHADLRGQFIDFANEGPYEINDEFELKSNIIRDLVYINLDVGFAKLELDKSEIGSSTDNNRQVKFDAETGQVTFTTTLEERQIHMLKSILDNDE
ncbi:nucleoid-associated protein [Vibrio fluvialis]|nr:nucleoid-associated protein [Vibrio fluvialis]